MESIDWVIAGCVGFAELFFIKPVIIYEVLQIVNFQRACT